ncbi:hypothetical protein [Streptomyces sp. I05A-00742]|uniref:hypothetical protein n=1 Tax=Streptomyces sp. I05A-00742 TaxID=2732853 RepID=UPI0014884B59|nr:hypothetical protein [Streptomyces sp. I05A-00742]
MRELGWGGAAVTATSRRTGPLVVRPAVAPAGAAARTAADLLTDPADGSDASGALDG